MTLLRYLWIVLLLLHAFISQAQLTCTDDLILYRKGNQWGVCDRDKKMIVTPKYIEVKIFYGKIIQAVKRKMSVNAQGGKEFTYEHWLYTADGHTIAVATHRLKFEDGYAPVYSKGKCGLIDTSGNMVIPIRYHNVFYAGEGMFVCDKSADYGSVLFDRGGKICFESDTVRIDYFRYGRAWIYTKNGLGSIGHDGKYNWFPLNPDYTYRGNTIRFKQFNTRDGNGGAGLIDYYGKTIIPANGNFQIVPGVNDNFLLVQKNDRRFGLYDTTGKMIFPPEYSDIRPLRTRAGRNYPEDNWRYVNTGYLYILLQKDTLFGLADSNCHMIIPVVYKRIIYAGENRLMVLTTERKWGIMDMSGNWIAKPEYEEVSESYGGMIWGKSNGKYTVIDHAGNMLGGSPFDAVVTNDRYFPDSFMVVVRDKRGGVLSVKGTMLLPCENKQIDFYAGMIYTRTDSTWAIYNAKGNLLHQQYNWIGYFSDGYTWALRGKKLFILDTTGNAVPMPDSITVKRNESDKEFHRGYAFANVNGKKCLVDVRGNVVPWARKYDGVQLYRDGFIVYRDRNAGYVDLDGNELLPPVYESIHRTTNRIFLISEYDRPGFVGTGNVKYFED